MKFFSKRLAIMLSVAALVFIAVPAMAVPGAFDFTADGNPVPDGTVFEQQLPAEAEVVFNVTVPGSETSVDWYLWAGETPGTTGEAAATLNFAFVEPEVGDDYYTATLPGAAVNGLANGTYVWDIIATDGNDGDSTTSITGGPFTFEISFPVPPRISPENEAVLDGGQWPDFLFEDTGADWYQIWIGHADYSYQGLFGWYQADDESAFGVMGEGICDGEVCTIPGDDLITVYAGGNAEYEWWMTYWTQGEAEDFDSYWNDTSFTVMYPAPATTLPDSVPADGQTVTEAPMTFSWDEEPGTLWYQIWVGPADYSETFFFNWVEASTICGEGTCTVDVSSFDWQDMTDYEVWVEFWGPNGYSTWTDITDNPFEFTIDSTFSPMAP